MITGEVCPFALSKNSFYLVRTVSKKISSVRNHTIIMCKTTLSSLHLFCLLSLGLLISCQKNTATVPNPSSPTQPRKIALSLKNITSARWPAQDRLVCQWPGFNRTVQWALDSGDGRSGEYICRRSGQFCYPQDHRRRASKYLRRPEPRYTANFWKHLWARYRPAE